MANKPSNDVAILTSFASFPAGYSLTGIVEDQIRMLAEYGHHVHLFVCEHFNAKPEEELFSHDPWVREHYTIHKVVPFAHLKDYRKYENITEEHKQVAKKTAEILVPLLKDMKCIFTHDWIFTGWNLPYADAIMLMSKMHEMGRCAWMHWIHSIPTANFDWWRLRRYVGKHRIIFPNESDARRVAEQYHCETDHVVVIPHIKDYRSYYEFHKDTYDFIREFPLAMRGHVVQVYPASTDRLSAKGVDKVISIFKTFKESNFKVCLIVANQWATGRQRKEDVQNYYKRARIAGLKINEEVIFTSEWKDKFATGIPRRMLRELQLISNLFIFPTSEESFGLVAPEAAMSGVLMVNNKSLSMMQEVQGMTGIYIDFGSFERQVNYPTGSGKDYYKAIAYLILSRLRRNEGLASQTFNRLRYNWNNLYEKYYRLIMEESALW